MYFFLYLLYKYQPYLKKSKKKKEIISNFFLGSHKDCVDLPPFCFKVNKKTILLRVPQFYF